MRQRLISRLFVLLVLLHGVTIAQKPVVPAPQDPLLVTISKETTRITEPLNENGYPDYLEAVNIRLKRKITTEQNGAILVLKTMGLQEKYPELNDEQKLEFYVRLGIDPLPADAKYLLTSQMFIDALDESELPEPNEKERQIENHWMRVEEIRSRLNHEFGACGEKPWKDADYPLVAKWLKAQESALAPLDRLRDYPRAYLPLLGGAKSKDLISAEQPLTHKLRVLVISELNIRAMHALGSGQLDAAIADFERMLVLQSYAHQNALGLVGNLRVFAMHGGMHQLFNQLLLHESLSVKQAEQLAELVNKYYLPPRSMLVTVDQFERLYALDIICQAAEFGIDGNPMKTIPLSKRQAFDYDFMLHQLNGCYDRLLSIGRNQSKAEREKALDQFEDELEAAKKKSENKVNELLLVLTKTGRSKLFADRLQGLLMPAINAALDVELKDRTRRDLWLVAIALRKFQLKHGKYPAKLEQLVPKYLTALPIDGLSHDKEPFTYRANDRGMLLYSVGQDRVDQQGFDGDLPDGWADDIAIFTEDHRPQAPIPAKTTDE